MRTLIIDGNNRFISAYVVNPALSINGVPIGGINGFLRSLQKSLREMKPDRVVIAWDGAQGSVRRRRINKNYKKGRKPLSVNRTIDLLNEDEKEQNRIWQQIKLMEYLNFLPVTQICLDNLEADDIIAFLCKIFKDDQKIIVSADKDFFQLLDGTTIISRPTQKELLNAHDIVERYDIHPNNFGLARAIHGDASDKLDGVGGVGLKTIAKRFPAFKNEKKIELTDLLKICEGESEKKKPLKVYEKILKNVGLIKENYSIIQLDYISFSVQNQESIRTIMSKKPLAFNRFGFMKKYKEDGLTDFHNFNFLMTYCGELAYKSKKS